MGQIVTRCDELARHQLALCDELGFFEDGHDTAEDPSGSPVNLVFQVSHHYFLSFYIYNSYQFE